MKLPYPVDVKNLIEFPVFFSCIPVDLLDQDKRPILEGRSIYHKPDSSNYTVCHYQGRRKKHDYHMNKMALKLAWQHTDEIIYTLQLLKLQTENFKKINGEKLTKADRLYATALSGFKTANFHLANSVLNENDFIYPSSMAALCKISHGLCHLIFNSDKCIINNYLENNKIDELYHYIDSQDLLLGYQTREVCAGPAVMIKRVLAIFANDEPINISKKNNPLGFDYYFYASITSIFEALSSHYELYNICYLRSLCKPVKKKYTIPYAHHLYNLPSCFVLKDIRILGKLKDLAWILHEDASLAEFINKMINKLISSIERMDFEDKRKIDIDFLILCNKLNDILYRLFKVSKNSAMTLKDISFFFNAEPVW
ncbi:hypothetical protein [Pantoea ananatis]